jgi:hypothetical protein
MMMSNHIVGNWLDEPAGDAVCPKMDQSLSERSTCPNLRICVVVCAQRKPTMALCSCSYQPNRLRSNLNCVPAVRNGSKRPRTTVCGQGNCSCDECKNSRFLGGQTDSLVWLYRTDPSTKDAHPGSGLIVTVGRRWLLARRIGQKTFEELQSGNNVVVFRPLGLGSPASILNQKGGDGSYVCQWVSWSEMNLKEFCWMRATVGMDATARQA